MFKLSEGLVHASCVDIDGQGVLIMGSSGSGKSTLSAELISRGAKLVSDDQTVLTSENGPVANAPTALLGMLELRGVGLVRMSTSPNTIVELVVDMDAVADQRLPHAQKIDLFGFKRNLISGKSNPNIAAVVLIMLRSNGLIET